MTFPVAHDPVEEGADTSSAPAEQASPDAPTPIPTGFPEPPANEPEPPQRMAASGNVILAPVPPLTCLTVPPEVDGGENVVITAEGTEVDEATAERARAAAAQAGFGLREL